jgi:flagellar biosynthesis GTPase FlhF
VAKSPTEQVRELALEVRAIAERERAVREYLADLKARDEKREREIENLRKENAELRREVSDSRQETAVLKQLLNDHVKKTETQEARRWTIVLALLGGVLTLATGSILTLLRK